MVRRGYAKVMMVPPTRSECTLDIPGETPVAWVTAAIVASAGEAKGRIVPVRFAGDDLKRITAAAKAQSQTVSEWIRSTLNAAIQE